MEYYDFMLELLDSLSLEENVVIRKITAAQGIRKRVIIIR